MKPKVGDRVRVTYEGIVSQNDGGFPVSVRQGEGFNSSLWPTPTDSEVEVLERADDPSKDPVGTVRKYTGHFAGVYVKTSAFDGELPWLHMGRGFRQGDSGVTLGEVVGAVPGTPAAETTSPEYEYYRGRYTGTVYRVDGDEADFFVGDTWVSSSSGSGKEIRREGDTFDRIGGLPSDISERAA